MRVAHLLRRLGRRERGRIHRRLTAGPEPAREGPRAPWRAMSVIELSRPADLAVNQAPDVDIVVPVYNEVGPDSSRASGPCMTSCTASSRSRARITIADNASTDGTWDTARWRWPTRCPACVRSTSRRRDAAGPCGQPGRPATRPVVAYLDVDLSTGLDALLPLVAPLVSGHSDIAIGTRLAPGARVVRGPVRELISRWLQLAAPPDPAGPLQRRPVRVQGPPA